MHCRLRRESKGLAFVLAMQDLEGFAGAVMDNAGPKRTPCVDRLSRATNSRLIDSNQTNEMCRGRLQHSSRGRCEGASFCDTPVVWQLGQMARITSLKNERIASNARRAEMLQRHEADRRSARARAAYGRVLSLRAADVVRSRPVHLLAGRLSAGSPHSTS